MRPGAPAGRSWRALGTSLHVLTTDPSALDEAAAGLAVDLDALDRACSRFRPDSELVALRPGRQRVGPVLGAAVEAALAAARSTGGLVDPTLGRSMVALGYDRTFAALPLDGPTGVPVPGRWREVDYRDGVLGLPDGVLLDLGATAKAQQAERCAQRAGHLEHAAADLDAGRHPAAPRAGPAHRTPGRHAVDDRLGGGGDLSRGQHREHRGGRARREGPGLVAGPRAPARLVSVDGDVVLVAGWPRQAAA